MANVDAQISIKRDPDSGRVIAKVELMRDGEEGEEITSRLEVVEVAVDDLGQPVTSCVTREAEAPPKGERSDLTKNQVSMFTILKAAGAGGLALNEWNERARAAGLGIRRRTDLLDFREAIRRKKLVHEYNGIWYAAK